VGVLCLVGALRPARQAARPVVRDGRWRRVGGGG
jgi:hypothetical protein